MKLNGSNSNYINKQNSLSFKGNPLQKAISKAINGINSDQFVNKISSPSFAKWSVAGIIGLNMITRPAFTMTNKDVEKNDRIYSASRVGVQEFIGLISHIFLASAFEWGGFKLAKSLLKKNKEFLEVPTYKAAKNSASSVVKGSIALGSMLGSVAALAFVAPTLNNLFLPSLLKAVGIKIDSKSVSNK